MQSTLIKIGKQILANQSDWEELISKPKIELFNKKGEEVKNKALNIILNLDEEKIIIAKENLIPYDGEKSPAELANLDTELWGRRGNKIAVCVEAKKMTILNGSISGEFVKAIKKDHPDFEERVFFKILEQCSNLPDIHKELDKKNINSKIKLGRNEKLILIYVTVVSKKHGFENPTHFKAIDGYSDYISNRFLKDEEEGSIKLCYSTGELKTKVSDADFKGRVFVTKIFQATKINNASNFDKKNFSKNYQVDAATLKALDVGAKYVMENLQIRIAGISHNILPNIPSKLDFNLAYIKSKVRYRAELLFQTQSILEYGESIEDETDQEIYWLNFVAYESAGNSYKIINQIKDVSSFQLNKIWSTFKKAGIEYEDLISNKNAEKKYLFNLNSIYYLIPVRKDDKEKKNAALLLFKQLLENRKIDSSKLFKHFKNLILCHWYKRYDGYSNIRPNEFYFGVKDAVFKYLVLFQILESLNLLKNNLFMETQKSTNPISSNEDSINAFLSRMRYGDDQKALFHLGRVLNSVAYAQKQKNHSSLPVLKKVNYNGMDKKSIMRFRKELAEKVSQYNLHGLVKKDFAAFTKCFPVNEWTMNSEEAVFFILSGYSFNPNN